MWIVFYKGTPHNPVSLSLVTVKRFFSSFMMWTFACVKTALYSASHILTMDSNYLCGSPDRIWTSLSFGGGCGNVNVHSLVDIIVPPFGMPTVISGLLAIVVIGTAWIYVMYD